jgi:ribosomal protein S12 methylthiotransferase
MKTKTRKKKINIVTLGCSKNIVDSEVLYSQLKANNIEVEHESAKDDANIVVINTCGFIDNAKQESVDTIFTLCRGQAAGAGGAGFCYRVSFSTVQARFRKRNS